MGMLEDTVIGLPTALIVGSTLLLWAVSVAGFYFTLKGRLDAGATRMDHFSRKFDDMSARIATNEDRHEDHNIRIVRIETLWPIMDQKLDHILIEVRGR